VELADVSEDVKDHYSGFRKKLRSKHQLKIKIDETNGITPEQGML
jgi:hypothetical protein